MFSTFTTIENPAHGREIRTIFCAFCHTSIAIAESRVVLGGEAFHSPCFTRKLKQIGG